MFPPPFGFGGGFGTGPESGPLPTVPPQPGQPAQPAQPAYPVVNEDAPRASLLPWVLGGLAVCGAALLYRHHKAGQEEDARLRPNREGGPEADAWPTWSLGLGSSSSSSRGEAPVAHPYRRAVNFLAHKGMSKTEATRLLDIAIERNGRLLEEGSSKAMAQAAFELRSEVMPGQRASRPTFVTNGRRRGRGNARSSKRGKRGKRGKADNRFHDGISDYWGRGGHSKELKQAISMGTRQGIPRAALERAAASAIVGWRKRGFKLPRTAREWYSEITSEDWLESRYRQEVINGRNIGSEYERSHGGKRSNWRNTNPYSKRRRNRRNGDFNDRRVVEGPQYEIDAPVAQDRGGPPVVPPYRTYYGPDYAKIRGLDREDPVDRSHHGYDRGKRRPLTEVEGAPRRSAPGDDYYDPVKVHHEDRQWRRIRSGTEKWKPGEVKRNGRGRSARRNPENEFARPWYEWDPWTSSPKSLGAVTTKGGAVTQVTPGGVVSTVRRRSQKFRRSGWDQAIRTLEQRGVPPADLRRAVRMTAEAHPYAETGTWSREQAEAAFASTGAIPERMLRNGQWLSGTSWRIERTPDGGSVTTQRDGRGRIVERVTRSAAEYASQRSKVRGAMNKRASGAVAILVRQGVSKAAAKRAVDYVGADSSDDARELASRARNVLSGKARIRSKSRRSRRRR